MQTILRYFPSLNDEQKQQMQMLHDLYIYWNEKINVISRKDMDSFYLHHVLHSLAIANVQWFNDGAKILDVGTGGGFPGIPLAILFPDTRFVLVDSIAKKTIVVKEVAKSLKLKNVEVLNTRVENISEKFDFIVSRAVTQMPKFVLWVSDKLKSKSLHRLHNGILYLKGGDLTQELQDFPQARIYPINQMYQEPFFETKKVVHLPL